LHEIENKKKCFKKKSLFHWKEYKNFENFSPGGKENGVLLEKQRSILYRSISRILSLKLSGLFEYEKMSPV